jgi:hypothetical protein
MNVLTGNTQDLLALVAKIGSICLRTQTTFVARYLHKITDLNMTDILIFQSELSCTEHSELFNFFCVSCDCLICSGCVLSNHNGHMFSSVDETVLVARYLCHSLPIKNKINTIIRKITYIFTETSTRIYWIKDLVSYWILKSRISFSILDITPVPS